MYHFFYRAVEICLSEVSRCDFFIGILGNRYGYIPSSYIVPDSEEFDWLKDYPTGCSVTELEIQHAALNKPEDAVGKAFFYIRDPELVRLVILNVKFEILYSDVKAAL